jgi:hypothetical protein
MHALGAAEVERIASNLVGLFAAGGSSSDQEGAGSAGERLFRDEPAQDSNGVGADRPGDGDELDDVDPPLATLVFGNEGLGFLEVPGGLGLGQVGLFRLRASEPRCECLEMKVHRGGYRDTLHRTVSS